MGTFKLGQRIIIEHRLKRIETIVPQENGSKKRIRSWLPIQTSATEVMIVGRRTLYNGETFHAGDGVWLFDPKEHFEGLLVVESINKKPFLFDTRKGWDCPIDRLGW